MSSYPKMLLCVASTALVAASAAYEWEGHHFDHRTVNDEGEEKLAREEGFKDARDALVDAQKGSSFDHDGDGKPGGSKPRAPKPAPAAPPVEPPVTPPPPAPEAPVTPPPSTDQQPQPDEAEQKKALRAEYKELTGSNAVNVWSLEILTAKVTEARAAKTQNA